MDTRYSQISSSSPLPPTGSAPLLVRANWLKGGWLGWKGREYHNYPQSGENREVDGGGRGAGRREGLLVMFDVIYPTASAFKALLPPPPFSSSPVTLTDPRYQAVGLTELLTGCE